MSRRRLAYAVAVLLALVLGLPTGAGAATGAPQRFVTVDGRRLVFETAYQRRTPGFEINDVGFLRQADQQAWTSWANLAWRTPNRVFQQLRWNFNNWEYWSAAGLPTEMAFNTNVHTQLTNRWWLHLGGTWGQVGGHTFCDRCARGGPAIRQDPYISPWGGIEGDDRKALVPFMWVNYNRGDGGRSESLSLQPELALKVSSRFSTSLAAIDVPPTPLQQQITRFVRNMAIVGVVVFLAVWAVAYARSGSLLDSLLTGLTLAMSILPEEIPVAFATFLALGAWRLACLLYTSPSPRD